MASHCGGTSGKRSQGVDSEGGNERELTYFKGRPTWKETLVHLGGRFWVILGRRPRARVSLHTQKLNVFRKPPLFVARGSWPCFWILHPFYVAIWVQSGNIVFELGLTSSACVVLHCERFAEGERVKGLGNSGIKQILWKVISWPNVWFSSNINTKSNIFTILVLIKNT